MRVLDLFSGIGAFSLGLERAGMTTISFCEIDPFCRRVLAKHWPEVHCYHDVRELSAQHLTADGHRDIDLICGGFPCQDISIAGKGAGISGERSGLWREFSRLIGEIRPRYAIVENVAALLHRGLGDVLGDLAALGYDAEWHCIPASALGAPHRRDRIWIVAYADECGSECRKHDGWRPEGLAQRNTQGECKPQLSGSAQDIRNTVSERSQGTIRRKLLGLSAGGLQQARRSGQWWATEPDVGRVVDGLAAKVDRRKRLIGLGNSLVPQIPEMIGRAIMAAEATI